MLGLLMLDTRFPRPQGDIGHPDTFAFAVRRRVVSGAVPQRVVSVRAPALLAPFIEAGHRLVAQGCSAIATSCGFLAVWQRELQAALPVPVWTSSLLLLHGLQARTPRCHCGVITIDAAALGVEHLQAVGADPHTPFEGITPGSALHRTLMQNLPALDPADAVAQVLAAARRLRLRHPQTDTLLLECTNLPPYAAALRRDSGLPVHDVVTMINERMASL